MHAGVFAYGVEDGVPCGGGRAGVDVEWKEQEEGGCGEDKDEEGKEK